MKSAWLAALVSVALCGARAQELETNVNERYTVESVDLSGADQSKLDRTTRDDLDRMVGRKFNQEKLNELSRLVRKAFPGRTVSVKVSRGRAADSVRVVFEVKGRSRSFDLAAPKAVYSARQGWSGELDAAVRVRSSLITAGVLSDGDSLLERFSGVKARYENLRVATPRLRLSFEFASLHQEWNGATVAASADANPQGLPVDLYRTRQNFEPVATIALSRNLSFSAGVSFERLQRQFPAARTEAANSIVSTLRYDRQLEDSGPSKHRLEAGYGLRAATRTLASDFVYARHTGEFGYTLWRGPHKLTERFEAGCIVGAAPLFERFVLGNSTTLRGWNKYDVAPLGGDRMAHNSLEYRYRSFRLFYDMGDVWLHGRPVAVRHSAGLGLQWGDFALLVAFPLRNGRAEPVILLGLNL